MKLNELLTSKIYVRNGLRFPEPKALVEPFLESVNANDGVLTIKTQNEVVNANEEGTENIAYPRFLVEVKHSDIEIEGVAYQNIVGLLVAMNQQSPMVKVYSGLNVSACLNLTIFNAKHVFSQNLLEGNNEAYEKSSLYYNEQEQKIEEYSTVHKKLSETILLNEQVNEIIGRLLRASFRTKLGTSPIVQGVKNLSDSKSKYYFEGSTTLYNVYNAITQSITDSKDLLYKPDKTIALSNLLLN